MSNEIKGFLKDLNPEQLKAALTLYGYVLVIAGAGSGKTKTLMSRTANILSEGGNPEEILLITFTKKAALEMKYRICSFPGIENGSKITATTFHAFCCEVLRHYAKHVGFGNDFQVMSEGDAKDAIKIFADEIRDRYKRDKVEIKHFPNNSLIMAVHGKMVSDMIGVEAALATFDKLDHQFDNDVIAILENYKRYKKSKNMMDFEDLLWFTYKLFDENESVRSRLDNCYKYIMCDEYQDTNVIQERLLQLLTKDVNNLCVVGDDNQSIYKFRGAHIENILTFEERYDNVTKIVLNKNYRSTQEILDVANAMMEYAVEGQKKHLTGFSHGNKVRLLNFESQRQEAKAIANSIKRRIDDGVNPKEIAVMARNGNISTFVEQELQRHGITFKKFGGLSFFERAVIRDLLSYLRVLVNPLDELAAMRMLTLYPKIGSKAASKINEQLQEKGILALKEDGRAWLSVLYEVMVQAQGLTPHQQIRLFAVHYQKLREQLITPVEKSSQKHDEEYQKLMDDMQLVPLLEDMAGDYASVQEMLEDFYLNQPAKEDESDAYVNVTTVHSAKGLEYDIVFLIDPVMGIFPHDHDAHDDDNKEDLRVMYVAITRPRKELYICVPKVVYHNGKSMPAELSMFLARDKVMNLFEVYNIN